MGPLRATLLRRIDSRTCSGSGVPWVAIRASPASTTSQSNSMPVASRTRRVASASSGPMPSPGIRVTRWAMRPIVAAERGRPPLNGGRSVAARSWSRSGSDALPAAQVRDVGQDPLARAASCVEEPDGVRLLAVASNDLLAVRREQANRTFREVGKARAGFDNRPTVDRAHCEPVLGTGPATEQELGAVRRPRSREAVTQVGAFKPDGPIDAGLDVDDTQRWAVKPPGVRQLAAVGRNNRLDPVGVH